TIRRESTARKYWLNVNCVETAFPIKYDPRRLLSVLEERRKMESSSSECPIDSLPPEIMHIIFDFLDLETLKSVSLTCHRWERIFAKYCTSRFKLCIDTKDRKNPDSTEPPTKRLQRATKMLQRTQRVYRHVHLSLMYGRFGPKHTNGVFSTIFAPHWLQQLVVLDLNLALDSEHMVTEVSDAIAKMSCLQELSATFCHKRPDGTIFIGGKYFCQFTKLTNPSLHKLKVRCLLPALIDCPNMRSLDVNLELNKKSIADKIYLRHNEQEGTLWRVEQVEELVIDRLTSDDDLDVTEYLRQFLQHMPHLKSLRLGAFDVPDKMLQVIADSCPRLEELALKYLKVDDPDILRHLSKLTQLRNLGVWYALGTHDHPLSFAGVKLPRLEKLYNNEAIFDFQSLACIPSVKWCKISPNDLANILLAELPKMPALEMLVLEDVFKLPDLHTFLPPLPQLKRLVIYHKKEILQQYHNTAELAKLVPNVKRIEMSENKYRYQYDFVGIF
uniref:F-box domain-containing protein n=1 Tax=Anopheles merus TaxID=30066 RepID=A0A182V9R8_ANOME